MKSRDLCRDWIYSSVRTDIFWDVVNSLILIIVFFVLKH